MDRTSEKTDKIALIGPFADRKDALGMWAIHGDRSAVVTIRQALRKRPDWISRGQKGARRFCRRIMRICLRWWKAEKRSCWSDEQNGRGMEPGDGTSKEADVAILALGEDPIQGGEGGSRTKLTIPGDQMKLLREVQSDVAQR